MSIPRCLSACVLALLAAGSSAQDAKVHFDPIRDLPGYELVRASPDKDLYPLEAYDALLGDEMDAVQLAEVKKRWADERAAIDAKLAELAADPRAAFLYRLRARLGRNGYFSKIGWEIVEAPAPFALVVQRPSKDDPAHAQRIADLYKPWLVALAKVFDARVAEPTKSKPNPAYGAVALAVLATPGDFQTAVRYLDEDVSSVTGGVHDASLRLEVGHDDPFAGSKSARGRVKPLVTAAAVGLLQRHHAVDGVPGSVLLTTGLPQYLFEALGDGTTTIDTPRPRADSLLNALEVLSDPRKRIEFAIRLPDLVAQVDDMGLGGLADRQARKAGGAALSDRRAFWASFDQQCALWTHFLLDADEGGHRAIWIRYVHEILAGKAAPDAAKVAFEGADMAALERAFWTWVGATTRTYFPSSTVPVGAVDDLIAGPPAIAAPAAVPPTAGAPKPAPPEPPLDPKLLGVAADDLDSRIGTALVRAREGDLDGALAGLRELSAAKPVDPFAGRIARETARLAAVVALRDGWLATLAAKGGRLEIDAGGKKVNAAVQRVEKDAVVLAPNKSGVTSIPLASLRLADILRGTEKKEFQAGSEPWVRGYLASMAGDAKAEKLLKGDSPELRDLREDARVWMPETVRAGGVARVLDSVASKPLPKSRAEGEGGLENVRTILADDDLPSVVLRRGLLARYARASLAAAASGMEAAEFLRGRLTHAADGGVALVYDFVQPSEVEDFTKHAGYLAELRKKYPPLALSEADASVRVVDGRAVFLGPASWRLPVGFQAPFQVRYTFRFVKLEGEMTAPPSFDLLLCDDGKEGFVRATEFGWIWAVDRATGRTAEASPTSNISYFDGVDYEVEVVHDGARVTTRFAGEDRASCNVGSMRGGSIVMFVHSEQPVSVERLEVSGRVDTASLEQARRGWIDRRMAELGF